MLTRPKEFIGLTLFLVTIAVSFPLQIMFLFGNTPFELGAIATKIAPLNWVVIVLALVNAYFAYNASAWTVILSSLLVIAVSWNNWLVAEVGIGFSAFSAYVSIAVVLAGHALLLTPDAKKVLREPRLRWWLTPTRKRVAIRAIIRPVMGGELVSETFDISKTGAFISLEEGTPSSAKCNGPSRRLIVGSRCAVTLNMDQFRAIKCNGEVVRKTSKKGKYPAGFAVRFLGLNREERHVLSNYLEMLPG